VAKFDRESAEAAPVASSGPVLTFLFTDIEGSTALWESHAEAMREALERHDRLLWAVITAHGGSVFSTAGDAFAAAFEKPEAAVGAATEIHNTLAVQQWPTPRPVRVRIGIHAGPAQARDGDYFGPTLNRAARLMGAAHGGQTVCSDAVLSVGDRDLGVELHPLGEHRLKDLLEPLSIIQVGPGRFPELRSSGAAIAGLPPQRSGLIGRASELERLVEAIGPGRVVSVIGPGGMGKTRLAVQAAAEVAEAHVGGAVFIDLLNAQDPPSMWSAVVHALDLAPQGAGDIADHLVATLRARPRLLVWDGCEHVGGDVAELLERISREAEASSCLATSRSPLDVDGEILLRLGPLDADDATALLVERAQSVDVTLESGDEHAGNLVRSLDGIPLAIELAATRLRSTPVANLDLAAQTSDLVRLLDRPAQNRRPDRQRTLRSTLDWSLGRLDPQAGSAFNRLTVLAGSFDANAAGAVTDLPPVEILDVLSDLVDVSLLVLQPTGRYRFLGPLRSYGLDMLADDQTAWNEAHERHSSHYADQAAMLARRFTSADHRAAVEVAMHNLADFRQAMSWSLDRGRAIDAARVCGDLAWHWYHAGAFLEGIEWTNRCLDEIDGQPDAARETARCRTSLARLHYYRGDVAASRQEAVRAVATARTAGHEDVLGYALVVAAVAGQALGHSQAVAEAGEAVDVLRSAGDQWGVAMAAFYHGVSAFFLDQPELAEKALRTAEDLFTTLGDEWGLGGVTFYRGLLASGRNQPDEASALVIRAAGQLRRTGDRWRLMFALSTLADLVDGDERDAIRAEAADLRSQLGLG